MRSSRGKVPAQKDYLRNSKEDSADYLHQIIQIKPFILIFESNMRQRYFSPSPPSFRPPSQISSATSQLRATGSSTNLLQQRIINNYEQEIGSYSYNTSRQIGSGYSSKVYLGRSKKNGEEYAIKVINLKKISNSNLQMLENQIEIIKSLNHPNVVGCHDVFKNSEKCFIIMEYCPYGNLLDYLTKRGRLSETASLEIVDQIIEGYKYLVSQNVIHRDIKPANIIKGKNNWKIADFGFSIRSDTQIKSKYNVGTPLYMPPESLIKNIYSIKTDIFSIGILLYELLVGCTPWESRTEKDLIKKLTNSPFKIPERYLMTERTKKLLHLLCNVNATERMGKQQFLSLFLKQEKVQRVKTQTGQNRVFNTEIKRKPTIKEYRATSAEHFKYKVSVIPSQNLKSVQSQSTNQNEEDEENLIKRKFLKNNQILMNQFHFVRFMYFLLQNARSIPLNTVQTHHKLNLVILKHLLKLIKHLGDTNKNWFKLQQWEEYKKSQKFFNFYLTIKDYSSRYEKQYIGLLKSLSIYTVKEVNIEFSELAYSNAFSTKFYERLMSFIGTVINEAKNNLDNIIIQRQSPITKEVSASIQGLKSLVKYYKLIKMNVQQFQNFDFFQLYSQIKVQMDYRKVQNHSIGSYIRLKEEISLI